MFLIWSNKIFYLVLTISIVSALVVVPYLSTEKFYQILFLLFFWPFSITGWCYHLTSKVKSVISSKDLSLDELRRLGKISNERVKLYQHIALVGIILGALPFLTYLFCPEESKFLQFIFIVTLAFTIISGLICFIETQYFNQLDIKLIKRKEMREKKARLNENLQFN